MAAYNGISWSFVDGNGVNGINYNTTESASTPFPLVWNGQLIVSWHEKKSNSGYSQIRVASYDGTSWSFIDGGGADGINKTPSEHGQHPSLISFNSKLFVTWTDNSDNDQIRVASYDGTSWSFEDGNGTNGINKNSTDHAHRPKMQVHKNQLYATWREDNNGLPQMRVAVYDGNGTWTFPGNNGSNGIKYDSTKSAYGSSLIPFNNRLHAIFHEFNGTAWQIRVVRGES